MITILNLKSDAAVMVSMVTIMVWVIHILLFLQTTERGTIFMERLHVSASILNLQGK